MYEKYFQKAGIAAPGHEMPERNSSGDGGEHEQQHARFAVADGNGCCHGKENTSGQVGQGEQSQDTGYRYLVEAEKPWNHTQYIYRYQ